ncbi:peptide MFS transporter [Novosphingobium sp.]|uniref:peptide MFS transporter n=1 Tax=Novosphingobium sp. TaxID=1874826 RepID=UPI001D1BC135|nr:peptide MFS transporter [Novosphingobium sp.]MBX9663752.1 peptide MFS transporter [Novosphingobium sp.]
MRTTDLFGQPKGLWVLAGTEFWDRISFHGMVAMLVLYMTGDLLLHPDRVATIIGFAPWRAALEATSGALSPQALALQTFGYYYACVTGFPLLGGWIGDRVTGRKIAVGGGAAMMTMGHFALAFDRTFLIALVLLMCGAGLLRGNLSAQIKSLYANGDAREVNAFQYYYLGINFGAAAAPILSGSVAAIWGWHAGFAVAGFGMLIGLATYLAGQRWLTAAQHGARQPTGKRAPLTPGERRRVLGLLMIWPMVVGYWTAQAQIWNVYNIWLRDSVNLDLGGFSVPVPWFQSLDGLAPGLFIPLVLWIWSMQAKRGREPDVLTKLAIGSVIFGLSVGLLAAGPLMANTAGRAPIALPLLFHVTSNFGAMYYAPVILGLYGTRAPESLRGTFVGICMLAVAAGSILSGWMGGLYESLGPAPFWLINAAICTGAGIGILIAAPVLNRLLAQDEA